MVLFYLKHCITPYRAAFKIYFEDFKFYVILLLRDIVRDKFQFLNVDNIEIWLCNENHGASM